MVDKIDTSLLCIKLVLKILWFLPFSLSSSASSGLAAFSRSIRSTSLLLRRHSSQDKSSAE